MRPPLSVTIICLNEQANIARAIESVKWAEDIVVVDSGSTDQTVSVAQSLGARVLHNPWPGYGQQKNFAQRNAAHDWVLNIDADEEVTPELKKEIESRLGSLEQTSAKGFLIPRKTFYLGKWIRYGGWYPNYLMRLADRRSAEWTEPQVHEELKVRGETFKMELPLHHYSFPSIQDQVVTNLNFSRLGSEQLKRKGYEGRVLKLILKPIGKFFETYFLKMGFRDGLAGFIISVNASYSMFLKYAYLFESEIGSRSPRAELK
jgi:glycosyltransferase involved in cell wall biosynthesis